MREVEKEREGVSSGFYGEAERLLVQIKMGLPMCFFAFPLILYCNPPPSFALAAMIPSQI